jgi:hypothetical protein
MSAQPNPTGSFLTLTACCSWGGTLGAVNRARLAVSEKEVEGAGAGAGAGRLSVREWLGAAGGREGAGGRGGSSSSSDNKSMTTTSLRKPDDGWAVALAAGWECDLTDAVAGRGGCEPSPAKYCSMASKSSSDPSSSSLIKSTTELLRY